MKFKRFGALVTAMVLALSLAPVRASAVEFTDVTKDFWGYEDITKMANKGYAKGYEDGSFKPNGKMTAAETLLFCARTTGIDSATQNAIAKDWAQVMDETLPTANSMNVWAAKEMAVAVETGVLSLVELEQLAQPDPKTEKRDEDGNVTEVRSALEQTMSRENICMYLVRAMQLEPMARSLSNYNLTYKDTNDIALSLRPYVCVLTNFGIVQGKVGGVFDPKGAVTRAEMTTMLSRALDFMDEMGIVAELSEYTSYAWQAGTISAVTAGADNAVILTLTGDITGTQSYTLPSNVKIYKDNMLTGSNALKSGQYARLNLNSNGGVTQVRLSGALTTYMGTVSALAEDKLSVLVGGEARNFTIDRFTQVMAGKSVGDRNIIDPDAGYVSATCYVDELGHLAGVKLSGGTQATRGILEGVSTNAATGDTVLSILDYSGVAYRYNVPVGTAVTVNGTLASVSTGHVGKHVELRVNEDSNSVVSVAIDTVSKYVQGPITKRDYTGSVPGVTISDRLTNKGATHIISQSAAITFDGEAKTIADIQTGWFATALVSNNVIVELHAFPGSTVVEGILSKITYGSPTILQITQKDGSTVSYDMDMTMLPDIIRGGSKSTIDKLTTGDQVVVTMRYNQVERVEATPQTADLTGRITKVTKETGSVEMEVRLDNGELEVYAVPEGLSVTQSGSIASIRDLEPGQSIAMVTSGDTLLSIDIVAAATSATQIEGKVYILPTTSSANKVMTVLTADAKGEYTVPIQVNIKGANLGSVGSSDSISLGKFAVGDMVMVLGAYEGAVFNATYVLKK